MTKKGKKTKAATPSRLNICVILDESGSMWDVRAATISGFNEFLKTQQTSGVIGALTLTKFNTEFKRILTGASISEVKPLDEKSYTPNGATALHDAIAHSVTAVKAEVADGERVLCCILTDGEENSSREHSLSEVKALIQEREATGLWTFAYLGANQDAWAVGQKMGIPVGNMANYASTPSGTHAAFTMMARSSVTLACSADSATRAFYNTKHIPDPGAPVIPVPPPVGKAKDRPTWRRGR